MVSQVIYFADSSSGIGALGFNGKDFIIQLITFVIAYFILRKYAFEPIRKVLNKRRETIEHGVMLDDELKKEKIELDRSVEKTLHDTRVEADQILANASDTARQTVKNAEDEARVKSAAIIKDADNKIAQNTARARKKLESDLVGLISEVTESVIDERLDSPKDMELIKKTLKKQQTA